MEYNKSFNSIKRAKAETEGIDLPKPIPQVKKPITSHSAIPSISVPSDAKPDDSASPTGTNKSSAHTENDTKATKANLRKTNDEKIRGMIKETTENPTFKPLAGKKLSVKLETNNFMHSKTALLGGKLGNRTGEDKPGIADTEPTEGAPLALKKTLSIRLKSQTTHNSRSRLETSEDHPKQVDSQLHVSSQQRWKVADDSDDSDDVKLAKQGPRLASETLDSMLRAPSGPVVLSSHHDKRQGRSMFESVGLDRNTASAELGSKLQLAKSGQNPRPAASTDTRPGVPESGAHGGGQTEGVPQVLSRHKPRTASLSLRKSVLPKPPSAVRV